MALITIKIEGREHKVEAGQTVLEACRACGYQIPSLCTFGDGECSRGSCRVCLVEVKGARGLVASCVYPVADGMEISISSEAAVAARRASVELLLSNHATDCKVCDKAEYCELLHVARLTGAREERFEGEVLEGTYDDITPAIVRNTAKCILCGRCIERCKSAHGKGVLGFINRGFKTVVGPVGNVPFNESPCLQCGQCVAVCPTGALMAKSEVDRVDAAIADPKKYVVVQVAPAVRAALGECFGLPIGTPVTGKMTAALKRLGFDKVYDTNFGADLTIMEEANELVERLQSGRMLPMITSCSPGWVNFAETWYSDLLPHLSSCKSPHQMQGAIMKSYYAQAHDIDPQDIFSVSVMPCTAKKYEKDRPEMENSHGVRDVDAVITTRELADMIKRAGIVFQMLPDEEFDPDIMGDYSGAGVIFGTTGGVMEAALRTAYHTLTGEEYGPIEFHEVRGQQGVKEATIKIADTELRVAVASGMANAMPLLDQIREGKSPYHFIEFMCCPGGCINGGGQPYVRHVFHPGEADAVENYRELRANALYSEDERQAVRQSHNNPQIIELYEKYLVRPGSHKAHYLLHTSYRGRQPYPIKEA